MLDTPTHKPILALVTNETGNPIPRLCPVIHFGPSRITRAGRLSTLNPQPSTLFRRLRLEIARNNLWLLNALPVLLPLLLPRIE